MYLSSPGGPRRGPAVIVFPPFTKCPDGSVYRYVASKACAAPSSSVFLALQHRRGRWPVGLLVICVSGRLKCPSDPCKGASRRQACARRLRDWLSNNRAGREAPSPHACTTPFVRLLSYKSRECYIYLRATLRDEAIAVPAHFTETQRQGSGQHQRSNLARRPATALKSSAPDASGCVASSSCSRSREPRSARCAARSP